MSEKHLKFVSVFLVAMSSSITTATLEDGNVIEYKMPESCTGESYCFEKGNNYPEEHVKKLLNKLPILPPSPNNIRYSGSGPNDEPDCAGDTSNKPIYYVIDSDGKVRVVIQEPEMFKQIHTLRWCIQEGRIVNDTIHFISTTLQNLNFQCVSTKMALDFYVLSEGLDLMEIATVEVPVCCVCRYDLCNAN